MEVISLQLQAWGDGGNGAERKTNDCRYRTSSLEISNRK